MAVLSANGVALRYEVTGAGPPLCLIIGYRLHGAAWPDVFVESLAQRFSVLTFDNRGTGLSDKPADDYGIPTMAADVIGLLDGLGWARAHVLGFSMGGAIAQELAIRHPERVGRLVLFATFPGGLLGIPAPWPVLRRLFDVEGLSPEEAARQVWPVTYSAAYLAARPEAVEAQMRREVAYPTPDHAARGQGAALRAFSSGLRLSRIRAETLVATGGEDALVPPGNARILASGIPGARLAVLPGLGHRAIWEAPEDTAALISRFLVGEQSTSTSSPFPSNPAR
jgi:3-oxoadipate enol-lactonase